MKTCKDNTTESQDWKLLPKALSLFSCYYIILRKEIKVREHAMKRPTMPENTQTNCLNARNFPKPFCTTPKFQHMPHNLHLAYSSQQVHIIIRRTPPTTTIIIIVMTLKDSIWYLFTTSIMCHELSPAHTLKRHGHNCVQITYNTSGAHRVWHSVCYTVQEDSSAITFYSAEIIFSLALYDRLRFTTNR